MKLLLRALLIISLVFANMVGIPNSSQAIENKNRALLGNPTFINTSTIPCDLRYSNIIIRDEKIRNKNRYLLWTISCPGSPIPILGLSIFQSNAWTTRIVSNTDYIYLVPDETPHLFVDEFSLVHVIYNSEDSMSHKLELKSITIRNGIPEESKTIFTDPSCSTGSNFYFERDNQLEIVVVLNNGGPLYCRGNIYSLEFKNRNWTTPTLISGLRSRYDLAGEERHQSLETAPSAYAMDGQGNRFFCLVTPSSSEGPSSISVYLRKDKVWNLSYSQEIAESDPYKISACKIFKDSGARMNLLVIKWGALNGEDLPQKIYPFSYLKNGWKPGDLLTAPYVWFCSSCQDVTIKLEQTLANTPVYTLQNGRWTFKAIPNPSADIFSQFSWGDVSGGLFSIGASAQDLVQDPEDDTPRAYDMKFSYVLRTDADMTSYIATDNFSEMARKAMLRAYPSVSNYGFRYIYKYGPNLYFTVRWESNISLFTLPIKN